MLSILSTNLCHQPANIHKSPAILYLKLLQKPCCPMASPDRPDVRLDEGDIKPKEKTVVDEALERITSKKSKELFCDGVLSAPSEKIPTSIQQAAMCIVVIQTECQKCMGDVVLPFAKYDCVLAETAGTITGWVAGVCVMRVGKVAAFGLGGSIILLHFASECGYISVNWERIRAACLRSQDLVERTVRFIKKNSCYSVGFVGGFFFGVASS